CLPALSPSVVCKHDLGLRQNGKTGGGRFFRRSAQAIYILVGPDWRFFSRAFVFRSGSIAGATISRGGLAQRESSRIALQRRGEGAHAVFHSAARRDCVHVLSTRQATGLLYSAGVRASARQWLRRTVNGAADV